MNTALACMSLIVLTQGWDRPVIQESELAAPCVVRQEAQTAGSGAETDSYDIDSGNTGLPPLTVTPQPPDKEVVTRWEYDDEGRPVARTEEKPAGTPTSPSAPPEKQAEARVENAQEKRSAGRIATFWFLLPRR